MQDSGDGRGQPVGEQVQGQDKRSRAGDRIEAGAAQAKEIDDPAGPEAADPLQGLVEQPAIKGLRNHRLARSRQVEAADQAVVDAGNVRLDPPRHGDRRQSPKERREHPGQQDPRCRHRD
jgi:hypothetical protein